MQKVIKSINLGHKKKIAKKRVRKKGRRKKGNKSGQFKSIESTQVNLTIDVESSSNDSFAYNFSLTSDSDPPKQSHINGKPTQLQTYTKVALSTWRSQASNQDLIDQKSPPKQKKIKAELEISSEDVEDFDLSLDDDELLSVEEEDFQEVNRKDVTIFDGLWIERIIPEPSDKQMGWFWYFYINGMTDVILSLVEVYKY